MYDYVEQRRWARIWNPGWTFRMTGLCPHSPLGCSGGLDINRRLAYPSLTPSPLPRTASWPTCQSQKPSLLIRDSLTSVAHIGERKSESSLHPAGGGWAGRNEGKRMERGPAARLQGEKEYGLTVTRGVGHGGRGGRWGGRAQSRLQASSLPTPGSPQILTQ